MGANAVRRFDDVLSSGIEQFALEVLEIGIMVTDPAGRLEYANPTAERVLSRPNSALHRVGGRLVAADVKANASLAALLGAACGPRFGAVGSKPVTGDYLLAPSPLVHGPGAALRVVPLPAESQTCRAMIFLREIERICNLEREARELFGLTGAEAKLASAVASGLSVAEAAEAQSVSVATARAHLSRIFQKTGTRQQSQVAALLRGVQIPVDPARQMVRHTTS